MRIRSMLMVGVALTLFAAARVWAQEENAETQPESQPAQTTSAETLQEEAKARQELAEEGKQEADRKLSEAEEAVRRAEKDAERKWLPTDDEARKQAAEALDRAKLELRVEELRKEYAVVAEAASKRQAEVDAEIAMVRQRTSVEVLKTIDKAARQALSTELEQSEADAVKDAERRQNEATEREQLIHPLREDLLALRAQKEQAADDAERQRIAGAMRPVAAIIDQHKLIANELRRQADMERSLATACAAGRADITAYEQRFWIQNAYLIDAAKILLYAVLAAISVRIIVAVLQTVAGTIVRAAAHSRALPTLKRVQTLIQFGHSIAKMVIWTAAIVTILAAFGVSPGQSAGALGVIGLVLAGMFQNLVVDFVKGVDIVVGGHYYVGDFIEVGGRAGHVLDFSIKYTQLRTPSGQIVTLPNSQCVPSRRFPAGFVDNYVDVPLKNPADEPRAVEVLNAVGDLLNSRIEAIKQEPRVVQTIADKDRTYVRVMLRVLPTCDWVVKEHYIPMVQQRFAEHGVELAETPTFFYHNDVPTLRRLFSRQITDQELDRTRATEQQPTLRRCDEADAEASDR